MFFYSHVDVFTTMFSSYEQDRQTDRQTDKRSTMRNVACREVWPDNERIIIIMLCTLFLD